MNDQQKAVEKTNQKPRPKGRDMLGINQTNLQLNQLKFPENPKASSTSPAKP